MKDNSSFSAFQLAAAPIRSIQRRCRRFLVVYLSGNLGRTPGYLSRKYLQATVQKPNLVCGRLILSYYIPSVDSSGLDPLLPPSFHPLSSALPPLSPVSSASPYVFRSPVPSPPPPTDNPSKLSETIRSSPENTFFETF